MTDRPIIMSAASVLAILAGRKTQTRRVLRPQPSVGLEPRRYQTAAVDYQTYDKKGRVHGSYRHQTKVDDRLWVRESHAIVGSNDPGLLVTRADYPLCVPANYENIPNEGDVRWRSPIHMPRWASRLTLVVTDVRVQRLQDISEDDAVAEGLWYCEEGEAAGFWFDGPEMKLAWGDGSIECYARLWNSTHGPDAWSANPWVSAITFRCVQQNIDALTEQDTP